MWMSRRNVVKNWPAAKSQSPSSQARRCQPFSASRTLRYSGLLYWLSVTRAGMKMESPVPSQRGWTGLTGLTGWEDGRDGTNGNPSPRPSDSLAPARSALDGPSPPANSFRRFPSGSSPLRKGRGRKSFGRWDPG